MDSILPKRNQAEADGPRRKRRREDDDVPSTSSQWSARPANPAWDKTTYRVRRIPKQLDFIQAMKDIFKLERGEFEVHSIASDASDETEPEYKAATVSFRARPGSLRSMPGDLNEWRFDLPVATGDPAKSRRILFDIHFNGFTPLSSGKEGEQTIDCILIHGLGGHALGSFRSSTDLHMWPRDSLPKHCPQLRVWIYGYRSKLQDAHSISDVYDHADDFRRSLRTLRNHTKANERQTPIIFIVHSLGGLILKDAVIRMSTKKNTDDLLNLRSTCGALFFGVPGGGMNVKAMMSMVQSLPARYDLNLLDKRMGYWLRERYEEQFNHAFPSDSQIIRIFERRESPTMVQSSDLKQWSLTGPPTLLVDPTSATYGRPQEIEGDSIISINADHSNMIKFSENDHDDYWKVVGVLRDLIKHADIVIKDRLQETITSMKPMKPRPQQQWFNKLAPKDELVTILPAQTALQGLDLGSIGINPNREHRKLVMDSLDFDQAEARRATIKTAHLKTCKWLLQHPVYRDWLNWDKIAQSHGFLWIKGKPGTGKSTIMKFLLTHIGKTTSTRSIFVSFFFNARGEELEKSTTGMYRSLLFQLLSKIPRLQSLLESLKVPSTPNQWDLEALKDTIRGTVEKLEQEHVVCFVDALDECLENQVRDMVEFFEELGHLAIANQKRLHVCFSSRHYPHISIGIGFEIVLENQKGHSDDIDKYLSAELKAGKSKQVQEIKAQILEKASGIFLWVVLVVRILNKEYDKGRMYALQKRLQEIPTELNELFRDILVRDVQDLEELALCIQWILYAKRPLKREEFYFAMLSNGDLHSLRAWDAEEITSQDMERFVISSSKGLAETTRSNSPAVQFIHESVREFLLNQNAIVDIWSGFSSISKGKSHEKLKHCCHNYVRIDTSKDLNHTALLPIASSSSAATLRETITKKFPFLEYAVRHVLYHTDAAEREGITQSTFLEDFDREKWIYFENLLQKYQVRHLTPDASLLYILAERNLASLITVHRLKHPTLNIEKERYTSAIVVAVANNNLNSIEALLTWSPSSSSLVYKDNKGQTLLSIAAEKRYEKVVQLLLEKGADVNAQDARGRTPLWRAAWKGHEKVVQLLLEKGADANAQDADGRTPLCQTASNGHEKVVQLLLEKGADVNVPDARGRIPLWRAVWEGHEKMVQLLLEKGADVNAQDADGRTPLWQAASNGHEKVVQLLLEKGADVNAQDADRRTLLCQAVSNGHEKVVQLLLEKGANVNVPDADGRTPLWRAAWRGHEKMVQLLLEKGADINAQNANGWTPLWQAASNGYEKVVQLLLEKGADANTQNADGQTTLRQAAWNGREKVVQLLLEKGADVNVPDARGRTPLWWAAREGHEKMVQLLLEKGADVNAQNANGRTLLCQAALNGHEKVVQLLLEKGADVNAQNADRRTLLCLAVSNGHEKVVQLLLEKGADVNVPDARGRTPLWRAAWREHEKVVQLLLEKGADANAQDADGRTPLCQTASNGHEKVVQLLLEKGADVNVPDARGRTPLWRAVWEGHEKMVQLLLEKGADANAQDADGRTPLWQAASNGHEKVVQLLLEKGADVNAQDADGRTLLWQAASNGYEKVVQLLLEKGADANAQNADGQTTLRQAAWNGREKVVQLLLEKGADVNAQDANGRTSLWQAASNGREKVVQLLLEKGADANAQDADGRTLLCQAASNGHEKVVQLLLEKGADANVQDAGPKGNYARRKAGP
ncbi:hypothetical protein MMC25_000543 [Agyrium rufum]|nr:hypothetical protein [Agyrium rufum]